MASKATHKHSTRSLSRTQKIVRRQRLSVGQFGFHGVGKTGEPTQNKIACQAPTTNIMSERIEMILLFLPCCLQHSHCDFPHLPTLQAVRQSELTKHWKPSCGSRGSCGGGGGYTNHTRETLLAMCMAFLAQLRLAS